MCNNFLFIMISYLCTQINGLLGSFNDIKAFFISISHVIKNTSKIIVQDSHKNVFYRSMFLTKVLKDESVRRGVFVFVR